MYEKILDKTLETLECLPVVLPETGLLVGITREYTAPPQEMFQNDNYHFPMGTAFLHYGVAGISRIAKENGEKTDSPEKKELLLGISQVYEVIAQYFGRYIIDIDLLSHNICGNQLSRLKRIRKNMAHLSQLAPETFEEALQLYYLMWKVRCLNSFCADLGRLDVHLRSFFENDIASGLLTEDEAQILLCEFWEKLNMNNSGDTLINIMVGGSNPDGSDAGSRLSVLMLRATLLTKKTEPHINIRIHKNLKYEIYETMLQVQLMGHGQATIYNDDVIIPSLIHFGVPEELAYCYTNDGCTEILLDGYSGIDFTHLDAVATFELAFNNGQWAERSYRDPIKYWHKDCPAVYYTPEVYTGFASGNPEDCETFYTFYSMFLKQYEYQVRQKAENLKKMDKERKAGGIASLFLNGTYEYVLENGTDFIRGGFPFDAYMMFSGSIPTVADSLMALKQNVFDKKRYTIREIKDAILVNFKDFEEMRQILANADKFGNDKDDVDELAADIAGHFCQWLAQYRRETSFAIMPALVGWRFIEEASGIAATPDGRRYKDPISEHYCATPGKAKCGPTALINSIGKAKSAISEAVGVCAVHVTLPRNLGNDDCDGLAILDTLVSAAMIKGLNMLNIAIYDAELLKQAQKDPKNHEDIIVRVWGYSARFVDLCKEMQDHVISRVL